MRTHSMSSSADRIEAIDPLLMATNTKPRRSQFPAGRDGGARYQRALRQYNASRSISRRTQAPDNRTETQRRRDARRSTSRRTTSRETAQQRRVREAQAAANQARKDGKLANISPSEGSYNNKDYGKPGDPQSAVRRAQEEAFNRGASGEGTRNAETGTSSGLSKSEINAIRAEYDRLRNSGDVKAAEAYGKKKAKELAAKRPKNPYRKPEAGERKDRFSRDVAELKSMGSGRKKSESSSSTSSSSRSSTDPVTRYGSGSRQGVTRDTSKDRTRATKSQGSSQPTRSRSRATGKALARRTGVDKPVTRGNTAKTKSGNRTTTTRSTKSDLASRLRNKLDEIKKSQRQSRANRAGWSGNQNY